MDEGKFDVLIIGTGVTESITAAALSKAGFKVAHVDENPYYGGNDASLSLDELSQWADTQASGRNPKFTSISRSVHSLPQSRQYSISLRPSVIPSTGPLIASLISSGVSKYGGFRLIERVGLYHPDGLIKSVPGTKEDVFKSKDISLVDKRRLMRFLMFAVGDFEDKKEMCDANEMPLPEFLKAVFSLPDDIASTITYALSFCPSNSGTTLPALQRIRRYLRSAGRYGASPFLIGHYGGAGEIAQGFCRAAAVSGSVYILGRRILSITHNPQPSSLPEQRESRYSISLEDFPDILTANIIISSLSNAPSHLIPDINQLPTPSHGDISTVSVARCIAIIDQPIQFSATVTSSPSVHQEPVSESDTLAQAHQPLDAGILIFPPSTVGGGSNIAAATVLVMGEGTMSTPTSKWILYIALPLLSPVTNTTSAQQLLQPYLDATLALSVPLSDPIASMSSVSPAPALKPLFETFYLEHPDSIPDIPLNPAPTSKTYITPPALLPASPVPDTLDAAAIYAESVFWEVVHLLRENQRETQNDGQERAGSKIESFWSQEAQTEDSDEEDW